MTCRRTPACAAAVLLLTCGTMAAEVPAELLSQPWYPKAPPLPKPTGQVIRVTTVGELFKAARDVKPGGTILIADGHYLLSRPFMIKTDNVVVRGESGRRERVILDGRNKMGSIFHFTECHGVTAADLTIQNVWHNGFKLNANIGRSVRDLTIHNCVIHNIWQRGVKSVPGPKNPPGSPVPHKHVENVTIRYCLFYNDRPKRWEDDPYENRHRGRFGGNYIGGIDAMNVKNWLVCDNVFVGIHGRTGDGRAAIFIWNGSVDSVIERNIIIDCDRGICLGNSSRRADVWPIHCARFIVRNNFITRCPDSNILANYTRDCRIYHNTVHDPKSRSRRLMRVIHDADGLIVRNNVFSGPGILIQKYTGTIIVKDNLIADMTAAFVDPVRGNLHLKPDAVAAIGKAAPVPEVTEDFDRQPRGKRPDLGADQFRP